jgi:hypothetical protein
MNLRSSLPFLLLVAACGGDAASDAPAQRGRAPSPSAASVEASEAATIGRELFEIMDRVMAFKSAHFNQFPKDLPAMGVDSLTRTTVRRLTFASDVPTLVVAYRHTAGHAIRQCSGTNAVIEDSMLNGGAFEVQCILTSGESKAFTVGG